MSFKSPAASAALVEALNQVEAEFQREMVLGEAERLAVVLWIAHTYAYELFEMTPRLFITSSGPESGKSRLGKMIAALAANGMYLNRTTEAVLGRAKEGKADNEAPTIVMDQLDHMLNGREGRLLDTLCAGADKGALSGVVDKVTGPRGAEKQEAVYRDFFYPLAIGKIGGIPDAALYSRVIPVRLHPASAEEFERLYRTSKGGADPAVGEALAAAMDNDVLAVLDGYKPELPEGFRNRRAQKWRPLLAIAEAAGGEWPERARAAAVELEESFEKPRAPTQERKLLHEVCALAEGREKISGAELDVLLNANREQPLAALERGRMLAKFGLRSRALRFPNGVTKGYHVKEIEEAAARYPLPQVPAEV